MNHLKSMDKEKSAKALIIPAVYRYGEFAWASRYGRCSSEGRHHAGLSSWELRPNQTPIDGDDSGKLDSPRRRQLPSMSPTARRQQSISLKKPLPFITPWRTK